MYIDIYKTTQHLILKFSMLVSSAVDRGFEPRRVKPKAIKLVFAVSPLYMQHY